MWVAQALLRLCEHRGDQAGAALYGREQLLIQLARTGVSLADSPNDIALLQAHGRMSFRVAHFRQAMADYDRIIAITPDDYIPYLFSGYAHLIVGDESGYRDLCRRMLERFGQSTDPATRDRVSKACFVAPSAVNDLGLPLQFARDNVALRTAGSHEVPFYQLCAGMAEFRAGNYRQAADWLEKPSELPLPLEAKATSMLFLAMARFRLHQNAEARAELGRADEIFDTRICRADAGLITWDASLMDWLICQIVRREADQLMLGKQSAPTTATSN
jgi:tetratricopeptide (TPR) repeat protein